MDIRLRNQGNICKCKLALTLQLALWTFHTVGSEKEKMMLNITLFFLTIFLFFYTFYEIQLVLTNLVHEVASIDILHHKVEAVLHPIKSARHNHHHHHHHHNQLIIAIATLVHEKNKNKEMSKHSMWAEPLFAHRDIISFSRTKR